MPGLGSLALFFSSLFFLAFHALQSSLGVCGWEVGGEVGRTVCYVVMLMVVAWQARPWPLILVPPSILKAYVPRVSWFFVPLAFSLLSCTHVAAKLQLFRKQQASKSLVLWCAVCTYV